MFITLKFLFYIYLIGISIIQVYSTDKHIKAISFKKPFKLKLHTTPQHKAEAKISNLNNFLRFSQMINENARNMKDEIHQYSTDFENNIYNEDLFNVENEYDQEEMATRKRYELQTLRNAEKSNKLLKTLVMKHIAEQIGPKNKLSQSPQFQSHTINTHPHNNDAINPHNQIKNDSSIQANNQNQAETQISPIISLADSSTSTLTSTSSASTLTAEAKNLKNVTAVKPYIDSTTTGTNTTTEPSVRKIDDGKLNLSQKIEQRYRDKKFVPSKTPYIRKYAFIKPNSSTTKDPISPTTITTTIKTITNSITSTSTTEIPVADTKKDNYHTYEVKKQIQSTLKNNENGDRSKPKLILFQYFSPNDSESDLKSSKDLKNSPYSKIGATEITTQQNNIEAWPTTRKYSYGKKKNLYSKGELQLHTSGGQKSKSNSNSNSVKYANGPKFIFNYHKVRNSTAPAADTGGSKLIMIKDSPKANQSPSSTLKGSSSNTEPKKKYLTTLAPKITTITYTTTEPTTQSPKYQTNTPADDQYSNTPKPKYYQNVNRKRPAPLHQNQDYNRLPKYRNYMEEPPLDSEIEMNDADDVPDFDDELDEMYFDSFNEFTDLVHEAERDIEATRYREKDKNDKDIYNDYGELVNENQNDNDPQSSDSNRYQDFLFY